MTGTRSIRPARLWSILLVIAAIGGALRVAAAQGGLWLDEAWSAVFARDVATPAGVFMNIHHDNNHHLNTLWLQLVGIDAAPILQRGLSIACGTAAVVVAGLIAARQGLTAATCAALLFAVSPMLVTYGSEARGYAPMLLCLLLAVLVTERWLEDRNRPAPTIGLTLAFVLGILSQLTMVFGILAIAGWVAWRARRDAISLLAMPLIGSAGLVATILWVLPGASGFQFGNYQRFAFADFLTGLDGVIDYGFGIAATSGAFLVAAIALVMLRATRTSLYVLAIFGLPLGVALLQLGNPGIPRYYLVSLMALLLLASEAFAALVSRPGWPRVLAVALLAVVTMASSWHDVRLIANRRADPGAVIATIARAAPAGATIAIDRPRASAVIEVAAARRGYPLRLDACGRFLFVDRDGTEPFPATPTRCGAGYAPVAAAAPTGLSGTHWTLYERRP
ncbi:MAG: glycosyltransferase family 39 protein [Pseudomonadota bacterium]